MSDDGRRDRRAFEPPPWEREQFEELARRKAAEEQRRSADEAAARAAAQAAAASVIASASEPAASDEATGSSGQTAGPDADGARVGGQARGALDEAKVDALLLELSASDTRAVHEVWKAGRLSGFGLGALGLAMFAFGMVLLIKGGAKGFAGAGMVIAVALFVIGFAAWLVYRASRGQRS